MNLIAPSVHDDWRNLLLYSMSELATLIWQYVVWRKLGCKSPRKSLQALSVFLLTALWSRGWRRWDIFLSRLVTKEVMKHSSGVGIKVSDLIRSWFSKWTFPLTLHFRLVLRVPWASKAILHGGSSCFASADQFWGQTGQLGLNNSTEPNTSNNSRPVVRFTVLCSFWDVPSPKNFFNTWFPSYCY